MIKDYSLYFTTKDGQLFNAADGVAEYGSRTIDQKAARDVGVASPLVAFARVIDADSDVGTSLKLAIMADDDGAGTNEVELVSKTVLKAALTKAAGVIRIGFLGRGTSKKFLTAKVTTAGAAATAGKIAVWLDTDCCDGQPANPAFTI